jgi:N-hydroxyarylamine O-acetyltransferase
MTSPQLVSEFDLGAYLQRIGYEGETSPELNILRALVTQHVETIPFENLNPLLRRPVLLDVKSLQRKLIHDRRGGYCYEQNLVLKHALESLGFRVTGLAARVVWESPEGHITPRSHMLLRVDLEEGPFIVDVGFGGMTLTGPIRLEPGVEQATPHEPFRLAQQGEVFTLQANLRGVWKSLYTFDLVEHFLPDYEVSNWWVSTYPGSHFTRQFSAARSAPGRRYALRNNRLSIHSLDGRTEYHILSTTKRLRQTLETDIGLAIPKDDEVDELLERLIRVEVAQ